MADEQALDPQEDRRADLEAAIASVEAEQTAEPVSEPSDTPSVSPAGDRPVSEQAAPNSPEPEGQQTQQQEQTVAEPARKAKAPTAPVDWSPELKGQFGQLPEPVQRAIHQREVHINQVMQQTADARRIAESLVRTVEPYRALMQAEGVSDPLQAVDGLLKTAAQLSMGSQSQKAARMAQLVQHYGIDIETLDKALAGSLPQNTEEDRLNRLVEQRMAPVNQMVQQFEQARQYQEFQVHQQAAQTVEQMLQDPNYPYMDSVRTKMADLIDLATMRNEQPPTLDEAYQIACMSDPYIRAQMLQQQQNGFMQTSQQKLDTKRNAASSIVGRASNGTGGAPNLGDMSIHESIRAQMSGGGRI